MKRKAFLIHNLSEESLRFSEYLGGIANPSLALITNEHPLEGFGGDDITLITNQDKLKEKKFDGYEADSYSKRCPKIYWNLNYDNLELVKKDIDVAMKDLGLSGDDAKRFRVYEDRRSDNEYLEHGLHRKHHQILQNTGLKILYLRENGITPKAIFEENSMSLSYFKRETIKKLYDEGVFVDTSEEARKAFMERDEIKSDFRDWVKNLYKEDEQKLLTDDDIEKEIEYFMDSYHFSNGAITFHAYLGLERDAREDAIALDSISFEKEVESLIEDEQAYERWIDSKLEDCYETPYFLNNKGNKVEATLESLSKEMKNKTQASEAEIFTSAGNIRSALLKKTKSINKLVKKAPDFIGKEEFEAHREATNSAMHDLCNGVMSERYLFDATSFRYKDAAINALMQYAKTKSTATLALDFDINDDLLESIDEFLKCLESTPTEYSEVKLNEPLRLTDFTTAIIGEHVSNETKAILEKSGLNIMYCKGKEDKKRQLLLSNEGIGDLGSFRISKEGKQELTI